jgi:AcrR family transcriptional regulator
VSLPSVLGARPDEQQLLAYFHGRIGEEDLIELLEQKAAQMLHGRQDPTLEESERLRKLQSYLVRDFVESLFGLTDMLRQSMRSPRSFEQALVGDFSPVSLAEEVLRAFRAGRRSPTAAAFQFVELIRVVAGIQLESSEPPSPGERQALDEARSRGLTRLLALAGSACERRDFRQACSDNDFSRYVGASLPPTVANQWAKMILTATPSVPETKARCNEESVLL